MRGAGLGNHCSTVHSVLYFPSSLYGLRFFLEFCTSCDSACVGHRLYLMNTSFLFNSGLIQGFTVRNLVSIQLKSIDDLSINWRVSKRAYFEGKYALQRIVVMSFDIVEGILHRYIFGKRLRWSRGSVLAFSTQVRRFKPGRSRGIFRAKKSSAHLPSEGK